MTSMNAPDRPEKFHIHIDAQALDPRLKELLLEKLGFEEKNFVREGMRGSEYSPELHLTKNYWDREVFDRDFDAIEESIAHGLWLRGYVEGEYIASRQLFADVPRRDGVSPPFRIHHAALPAGSFRETEIHLTVDANESDPKVIDEYFEMGFFCAYAPKTYGLAQILTMQGSLLDLRQIKEAISQHILARGGLKRAKLMEERIIRWWASSPDVALPPVVGRIGWRNNAPMTNANMNAAEQQ